MRNIVFLLLATSIFSCSKPDQVKSSINTPKLHSNLKVVKNLSYEESVELMNIENSSNAEKREIEQNLKNIKMKYNNTCFFQVTQRYTSISSSSISPISQIETIEDKKDFSGCSQIKDMMRESYSIAKTIYNHKDPSSPEPSNFKLEEKKPYIVFESNADFDRLTIDYFTKGDFLNDLRKVDSSGCLLNRLNRIENSPVFGTDFIFLYSEPTVKYGHGLVQFNEKNKVLHWLKCSSSQEQDESAMAALATQTKNGKIIALRSIELEEIYSPDNHLNNLYSMDFWGNANFSTSFSNQVLDLEVWEMEEDNITKKDFKNIVSEFSVTKTANLHKESIHLMIKEIEDSNHPEKNQAISFLEQSITE